MRRVTQLWPDLNALGQCEAAREGRYANDKKGERYQCEFTAKFVVDGKRLCTKHAGVAALRILLSEEGHD